jgi:hypothetical protein
VTEPDPEQRYLQVRIRDSLMRVFDASADPADGDISDMYVLAVFGMSILIRLRSTDDAQGREVYMHIDNESARPTILAVEVDNGGDIRFVL